MLTCSTNLLELIQLGFNTIITSGCQSLAVEFTALDFVLTRRSAVQEGERVRKASISWISHKPGHIAPSYFNHIFVIIIPNFNPNKSSVIERNDIKLM